MVDVKLPSPELVVVLETSNCFLSPVEKLSRDVDLDPRRDEVLVKFSETHQGSDELICQNYTSWLMSI